MEDNKENMMTSTLSEDNDIVSNGTENSEAINKDPDAGELMRLIADPKIMRAYRAIRSDIYGMKERHQVSKKEKQKKKAKRRMSKKSRRG